MQDLAARVTGAPVELVISDEPESAARGVEGSQAANLFLPAHPDLLTYAGEIRVQRRHVLPPPKAVRAEGEDGPVSLARDPGESDAPGLEVLEARAVAGWVIPGADASTPDEILEARRYEDAAGLWHISDVDAARTLRAFRYGRM
ncbi:MAG: hypothetical protein M5R40_24300 [Anaerolineae bacterium]|nr:hypothetical protein [Anaerolineae bacterium]